MAIKEIVELVSRVTELERRVSGLMRHGTVADIDMAMFRVRLDLGPAHGGGKFLSPWIPYAQVAGKLRVHTPPEIGQQFTMISPTGDFQQAVAVPLHWSDMFESPSERKDENIITYGDVRIELREEEIVFKIGPMTALFCADGVKVMGAPLHTTNGISDNGGVSSSVGVWPPNPVSTPGVRDPGSTGNDIPPEPGPGA